MYLSYFISSKKYTVLSFLLFCVLFKKEEFPADFSNLIEVCQLFVYSWHKQSFKKLPPAFSCLVFLYLNLFGLNFLSSSLDIFLTVHFTNVVIKESLELFLRDKI